MSLRQLFVSLVPEGNLGLVICVPEVVPESVSPVKGWNGDDKSRLRRMAKDKSISGLPGFFDTDICAVFDFVGGSQDEDLVTTHLRWKQRSHAAHSAFGRFSS